MKLPRQRTPRRLPRHLSTLTTVALLATVVFTLVGIGTPLVGRTVFAATDQLVARSPYFDAGFAGTPITNGFLDDTYNAELPSELLFGQSTRDGTPALWNPYVVAGTPLGAVPNGGLLSPLALPYYVLPGWLAPAYGKLLETVLALIGCYLFLRRLKLRRATAVLGGLVFVTSAFMVVWTNWPQTRVAAFIPWVFWAVERLVQRRRVGDVALLALAVAGMLFGGFPAVTAFTLFTAGPYALARILAERRVNQQRVVLPIVGAAVALVGGLAIAAVQLLPFNAFYSSWLIEGRGQQPGQHLDLADLASSFAPWVYGVVAVDSGQPNWFQDGNIVEASSYVGAAALVLVVVALAAARRGRSLLPPAAWVTLVAATGAWLVVIYLGGPLALLQHLPVFSSNFIGRARGILGFLLAVLAAVGLEVLLAPRAVTGRRWRPKIAAIVVGVAAIGAAVGLTLLARSRAAAADTTIPVPLGTPSHLTFAGGQLLIGLLLIGGAAIAVGLLWWRRDQVTRAAAVTVLLGLIVGQALTFVIPYWPRVDRSTFYPTTDTHQFLDANLGHDRFVGTVQAMPMGVDAPAGLRALEGHAFINARLAALIRAVPENPITYATHVLFPSTVAVATSPVLDRLAGKYFVTSPRDGIFGDPHYPPAVRDSVVTLDPDVPVTAPVPTRGPLRAVGILPLTGGLPKADPQSWIEVAVLDAHGATLATARRLTAGLAPNEVFYVPIAGEAIPAGAAVTARVTVHSTAPLAVAGGAPGQVALGTVTPLVDGLRLVYAGSSVIYERERALPRIRWGARAIVEPDQGKRIAMLASGGLAPDQVVLDGPGLLASGAPAMIHIDTDGLNRITTDVRADGSGYLVVADALQAGWSATVDGVAAPLVPADQGMVAVPVAAGEHRVELRYDPPYHGLGTWLSAAALLTAVAVLTIDRRLARRRPGPHRAAHRAAAPHIGGPRRS